MLMANATDETMGQKAPALVDADGKRTELSQKEYELLLSLSVALGREIEASADPLGEVTVTTGQAAEMLGVSRRTLTRMLDRGELPCTRLGENHHRRLRLRDVVEFLASEKERRADALNDFRKYANELGLYELDPSAYLARFS